MNHWAFIWAAYGVTAVGTIAVLVQSLMAMRRAERRVAELEKRP
jgi:heme exporter protein CcmD